MKPIFLILAAIPLMGMAPTGASVVTVGGSSAASCFHAAAARDRSNKAMDECNSAIDNEILSQGDLVASHVNRGILRLLQNDYQNAEMDFTRATGIEPRQAEAWLNLGIAHYQQGRVESAARLFERSLELRTKYPAIAYFGRALANEDRGNIKGAYADLQRASQLNPGWDAPAEELKRFRVVGKI
ncbi:MAG: tetratricopeptide repeat protein [Pseudomonadota bacterium]|nr:tetratricopeptide repeat protein [Pseudomonadota bacterium]